MQGLWTADRGFNVVVDSNLESILLGPTSTKRELVRSIFDTGDRFTWKGPQVDSFIAVRDLNSADSNTVWKLWYFSAVGVSVCAGCNDLELWLTFSLSAF